MRYRAGLQPVAQASPTDIAFPHSDIVAGYADGVFPLQISIRQREILPGILLGDFAAFGRAFFGNNRYNGFVFGEGAGL